MRALRIFCLSADPEILNGFLKEAEARDGLEVIPFSEVPAVINYLRILRPDLLLVDADDFPRHWKVIASILEDQHKIKLLTALGLAEEEEKKARTLGIEILNEDPASILDRLDTRQKPHTESTSRRVKITASLILPISRRLMIREIVALEGPNLVLAKELDGELDPATDALMLIEGDGLEHRVRIYPHPQLRDRLLVGKLPASLSSLTSPSA